MLARLLFREETYSGPSQRLRSSRYIKTVKLLNDGRGVYPTIRARLLENELRFQARHGLQTRYGDNTRLESYAEDGQPGQKRFSHAIHGLHKGRQKKAGVEVSQAPAMLHSHLAAIIAHMTLCLRCTEDPYDRVVLARDIALFTVAFSTLKRGDGLSRTLIQRTLRLPNECGFLFNFQWGKTMRDGADHLMTVEYDTKRMTTCPIRAVEQYIAVGTALGWNMTQGYLFPRISRRPNTGAPIRGRTPISAPDMTKALKVHARNAGERTAFTMHSFRSGGAITRALTGEDLPTVMQRAFWKKPSTAWRYLRLMEVLLPGSVGNSMVTEVSPEQYREINEFGLSEQSRHWAAFGNAAMV